ncbi:hypothetical protein HY771_02430 [Candidatus Uhrbacteria bacterium]|nr:hypothetical protein [Candidatus Uhrbacteria bacterium]
MWIKHGLIILSLVFLILVILSLRGIQTSSLDDEAVTRDPSTLRLESRFAQDDLMVRLLRSSEDSLAMTEIKQIFHIPLPDEVRGFYWTASTAGSPRADELRTYMNESGLNTVVIDLKMDNGEIAFVPNNETLRVYQQAQPAIADLDALLSKLFSDKIYRIARIAVMRDGIFGRVHPEFALKQTNGTFWLDKIGSIWVDPSAPEVAEYAIALAREAYARGFDEVQFDYVRFASDGSLQSIVYPIYVQKESMVFVMQNFFKTVGNAMRQDNIPISFDLFGMTFWSFDDFSIGQRLIDVLPYADFVSPMVYPSHYVDGFKGYANPAEFPYEIVKLTLDEGTRLIHGFFAGSDAQLQKRWRPWLQDFDIGAIYTSDKIEAQIKAARDAGGSGWILWNARNVYEQAEY